MTSLPEIQHTLKIEIRGEVILQAMFNKQGVYINHFRSDRVQPLLARVFV